MSVSDRVRHLPGTGAARVGCVVVTLALAAAAAVPSGAEAQSTPATAAARADAPRPVGRAHSSGHANATRIAPLGANVVTVVAREYAFSLPDSIPAGLTTFVLRDEGHEQHHVFLVAVPDGKTPADLVAAIKAGGPPPAWGRAPWMRMIGGPNSPTPGGESNATLTLAPGRYMLFCVIPAPDGAPHVTKGMLHMLTVTRHTGPRAPPPRYDVAVTLTDYAFRFSRPISAGTHTLRITNGASQPHEMFMMRLPPGKTVADMVAWVANPAGPPPIVPAGGITDIPPGGVAYVRGTFGAGEYALICFSPDEKDGRPHFAHGMTKQFTVK